MVQQNINILLVEDEIAHAELVQRAFERRENYFSLSVAQTISEAKELLQKSSFALVLTDWRLPDGEGTDLIGFQQEGIPIPVVIMTSHGNERVAVDAIKAGALDYVVKSDTTLIDMAHIVERALRDWDNLFQRQRAEEQLRHRVAELEAVNRISTAMRSAENLQEMIPRLMDETLAILNTQAGIFWIYDVYLQTLDPIVSRGVLEEISITTNLEDCVAYQAFTTREIDVMRVFTETEAGKDFPQNWGGACVPIQTSTGVLGALLVGVELPRELNNEELHLLATLAEIAGNAIERTRLYEQTQKNLNKLAALRAIDQAITSSIDVNLSLRVLIEQAKTQLNVDAVSILQLDSDTQNFKQFINRGFQTPVSENKGIHLGTGLAGQAALEHRSIFAADLSSYDPDDAYSATAIGEVFHSYFVTPMITKGVTKGVIEVFHRTLLKPDQEWIDFLDALAGQAAIAIENADLFESLEHSNLELKHAYDTTIEGWSRALDLRDRETEGHTRRVTEMALTLAEAMGVDSAKLVHMRRGALLHDIGKMGIPDKILLKEGPLNEDEWAIMRKHPTYAYEMLSPIKYLKPAIEIPYCHHEFWDGSGYPRGLKGEEIPLTARIFAIADVWDALRSDRPYRDKWTVEKTREYIIARSETQFDPAVIKVFCELYK